MAEKRKRAARRDGPVGRVDPTAAADMARHLLDVLQGSDEVLTPEQEALIAEVRAEHQHPPAEGYDAWAKKILDDGD